MNYINISDLPSFVLLYTACSSSVNKMYIPQGVYETLRFCSGITYDVCKSDSEFDWLISNLRSKVWHFASANPPPTQTFSGGSSRSPAPGKWKGRDLTSWIIWKNREIYHFGR